MREIRFADHIPPSGTFWNYITQQFDAVEDTSRILDWRPYLPDTPIRVIYRLLIDMGSKPIDAMNEVMTEKWFLEYGENDGK